MSAYLSSIKEVKDQLAAVGEVIKENKLVLKFLRSLPETFKMDGMKMRKGTIKF